MKRILNQTKQELYHIANGIKTPGIHKNLRGTISPDLHGDISGLYGNITGLYGNLDDAELTDAERAAGIDIKKLIKEIEK